MKKIYFLLFLLFVSNEILAQDKLLGILPLKDGKVTYSNVVQLKDVSKDVMYNRIKHWFADTYNSGKDVIQIDDKETGEIIGEGCFKSSWRARFFFAQSVNIWKTIKIQLKEDRFRYEITDFRIKNYFIPSQNASVKDAGVPLEEWNKGHDSKNKKFYPKIASEMTLLINSLESAVKNKKDDIW